MKAADNPHWQALLAAQRERAAAQPQPSAEGDSVLLIECPRGPRNDPGAEVVRWSLDTFRPPDNPDDPKRYISGRRWYRVEDGSYKPTKAGVTIRAGELVNVIKALCGAARSLGLLAEKGGDRS